MAITVVIRKDGTMQYIDHRADELVAGTTSKRRARHVLPVGRTQRFVFIALRWLFGEHSRVAAWTRRWSCRWMVEIVGGPTVGPFDDRDEAISWEIDWIEENVL